MKFRRSERATALIEFAVVLPFLVLFVIGAAEFGRVYYAAITAGSAARAGAQYGAQNIVRSGDFVGMTAAAQNEAADVGGVSNFPSRFCRCPDGSAASCTGTCVGYGPPEVFVKDSVIKTVTFLLKYPGLPSSVTVRRTVIFRVQ